MAQMTYFIQFRPFPYTVPVSNQNATTAGMDVPGSCLHL